MKRTHTLVAALLLGLTLMLAGCGSDGGSDDDGVASATGKDSKKNSDDNLSEEDRQEAGLKFAKCMREHGIEMEDPQGGRIEIKGGPGDQAAMEKAQEACQKYLPKISEADRKKMTERGLEFAQCMRKNGVEEFPDPEGGGMMRMNEGIADDPDFKKAQEACQDIMGAPVRSGDAA